MKTFYEHQEAARANSAVMMGVLSLAIGATTLFTGLMVTLWLYVPLYWLFIKAFPRPESAFTIHLHADQYHPVQWFFVQRFPWMLDFPWELFVFFYLVITVAIGFTILITTRNRLRQLWRTGGIGVAESLGGVCVTADGYRRDDKTQRAVNVVNEIAIASRIPPPHVYLLYDEPGINAFAVGLTPKDTVLGLTAGCVARLNREQLQGVVAHEFAHIVNGDTRTNILLVGYLHGLMGHIIAAQSLINQGIDMMVKSISYGGQGIVGMFTIAAGVLLWPVGVVGLCFATTVKAAYSRQREYLADASAIEFTRNEIGLLSAMKRILGIQAGSRVRSASCLALSHVFFAKSCGGVAGWIDSHPPIARRIRRIDASWDGEVQFEAEHEVGTFTGVLSGTLSIAQQARLAPSGRLMELQDPGDAALAIDSEILLNVNEHASRIKATLPVDLWELTQDLPTAEAMVFALWAVGRTESADDDAELRALGETCAAAKTVADALKPHIEHYGLTERLMLFDASINLIRQACQTRELTSFCKKAACLLSEENDDGDLFRWVWRKTVQEVVNRESQIPRPRPEFRDIAEVLRECNVLLSALAYANGTTLMEDYSLLRAGNVLDCELEILPRADCGLDAIEAALERLRLLAPRARRTLVLAGSASIETDSAMNDDEALLMRGICSGLGYPPATVLPGQPVKVS